MTSYIIVFLILAAAVVISYFLAKRSMRDFQEPPGPAEQYGVFLVRLPGAFDENLLREIFSYAKPKIVAFERLFKGNENALVLYCPLSFEKKFTNLQLLELEDYSLVINSKNTLAWEIVLQKRKSLLSKIGESNKDIDFLDHLSLGDEDQVLYQVVAQPDEIRAEDSVFQVNMRLIVVAIDPQNRAHIAKEIDKAISETGFLMRKKTSHSSSKIVKDYRKRNFIPQEVTKFKTTQDKLIVLLK